jgi:hypothetical protein
MNLLEDLMNAKGGAAVGQLAQQFGLSGEQTQDVIGQLLPALLAGARNTSSQEGGLDGLLGMLNGGNQAQIFDDPSSLANPDMVDAGNGILGQLLGSKDVSRALASQVAGNTGLSDSLIKQMLPLVASMAMGAMSQRMSGGNANAAPAEGLMGMLDFNRDGNPMDDILGIAGKLFGGR